MMSHFLTFVQLLFLTLTSAQQCKVYPNDAQWPNATVWDSFNETIAGRLSAPFCPPNASAPCNSDIHHPAYVVEAINAADVQAGVNFARQHDLRLTVNATGHDYLGRSTGAGSLSIHTHKIQGLELAMHDPEAVRYGGVAAVKIAAGHNFHDIYTFASENNITIVGGAAPSVGIGGWILNAGHSPFSSLYGLGADQVLSFEVVTADGEYRTLNETLYPDLFWALRGGGGGTFAVLLSVTVKAYPKLAYSLQSYSLATSANSDTLWSLLTYFHTQIPKISEAGGMGYHYLTRGSALGTPDIDLITGGWLFPQQTQDYTKAVLDPVWASINTSSWAVDPISFSANTSQSDDAMRDFAAAEPGSPGNDDGTEGRPGSWLLDGPGLTSNFSLLKENLKTAAPDSWGLISHVIAGPGVRNAPATIPGGSNAVLPAWRKAYDHVVLPRTWPSGNDTLTELITKELREVDVPALVALSPDSGAYINEADPTNPDWKKAYYGDNYERLSEIKSRWDPNGVFWCKPCVGWDEWEIVAAQGTDKLEWGVGPALGRLCRRS